METIKEDVPLSKHPISKMGIFQREMLKKISNYLHHLFKFLDKYCFIKGAFVIEDTEGRLFELLNGVTMYTMNLTKLGSRFETHTTYKDTYPLMEIDVRLYPIIVECTAEKCKMVRTFGSFKWYRFTNNGKQFIFIKPERSPTLTLIHGVYAVNRYILKSGKQVECIQHRREDCGRDNNCDYTRSLLPYRNFKTVIIRGVAHQVTETYQRKGDEAFILEKVSHFILDLMDQPGINVKYSCEKDTMTISSYTAGGKYKRYSNKNNPLKNKTNKIKRNISKRVRKGKY